MTILNQRQMHPLDICCQIFIHSVNFLYSEFRIYYIKINTFYLKENQAIKRGERLILANKFFKLCVWYKRNESYKIV